MISESMKKLMKGSSMIRQMFEEGKRLAAIYGEENVYDFSVGNPGLNPPKEVYDAIDYINHEMDPHTVHGYPSNSGFKSTRQAVADDLNRRFGGDFTAESVIITVGACGAINDIMKCLFNPGDKQIVFAPFFVEYDNWASNYGAETLVVPPNEAGGFQPDAEGLRKLLDPGVKAIILNNPNNPTGVIYTREAIEAVAEVLREAEEEFGHPIYIISDEPYRELVYTDDEIVYIPGIYDDTIIAYSWSKSLSMPGDRIGYVAVPGKADGAEELCNALVVANREVGGTNAPTIQQLIAERCMDARVNIDYYKDNAALLYRIVTEAGFKAIYPQGAFYLWIKSPVENEQELVDAAKELRLLIVPGRSFAGPGWVRASFCISTDTIARSEDSWKKLGEKYFG